MKNLLQKHLHLHNLLQAFAFALEVALEVAFARYIAKGFAHLQEQINWARADISRLESGKADKPRRRPTRDDGVRVLPTDDDPARDLL